jgi:predicted nucleotidyltransferase
MREQRELRLELERDGVDAEQFVKYSKADQDEAFERAIRELEPGLHWTGEAVSKISIGTRTAVCVRVMEILGSSGPAKPIVGLKPLRTRSTSALFRCASVNLAFVEVVKTMERPDALVATLRAHEDELRKSGIRALSIFGSVARGEQGLESDIDVSVQLDPEAHLGLFRFVAIQSRLIELLGRAVQLLPEPVESPRLQANLDRDRRRVF